LAATISGANVHDKWMLAETLDAVVVRAPRGPRRPRNLCLDKGYDYRDTEAAVRRRRIRPHIRRRGENALLGCARGKPRRWVVERTNSWHNRFRALLIRWERKSDNYLGMLHLACGLIALRTALPQASSAVRFQNTRPLPPLEGFNRFDTQKREQPRRSLA
jgi:putative transposase